MQSTRQGILEFLRERGSGTVEALAEAVGLAPVTVRHHLSVLRARGMVETTSESVGRGRPRHVFSLSPRGAEAMVDDGYQALAGRLLDHMKARDGHEAEHFFRGIADRIVMDHRAEFEGRPIESRLETLSKLLGGEGFTMRWEREQDGYLLYQVGCPYHSLSHNHAEVCLLDLELVTAVTGGRVRRESWRRTGDDLCVLRVDKAND